MLVRWNQKASFSMSGAVSGTTTAALRTARAISGEARSASIAAQYIAKWEKAFREFCADAEKVRQPLDIFIPGLINSPQFEERIKADGFVCQWVGAGDGTHGYLIAETQDYLKVAREARDLSGGCTIM